MDRQFTALKMSISKRVNRVRFIERQIGALTEFKKEKFFNLVFPKPLIFKEYEIKFEKHHKKLSDKIKNIFWKVKQTSFTNLDMDHLAEEPYKKFKPSDYLADPHKTTISWTGSNLDAPLQNLDQ